MLFYDTVWSSCIIFYCHCFTILLISFMQLMSIGVHCTRLTHPLILPTIFSFNHYGLSRVDFENQINWRKESDQWGKSLYYFHLNKWVKLFNDGMQILLAWPRILPFPIITTQGLREDSMYWSEFRSHFLFRPKILGSV